MCKTGDGVLGVDIRALSVMNAHLIVRRSARKDTSMRLASLVLAAVLIFPTLAVGQETHKPEEWQKLYEDASQQLRAAQDRKAQLSLENAKLADQVKDLQAKLQAANAQVKTLKLQTDSFDERTFYLTTYFLYWDSFLQ